MTNLWVMIWAMASGKVRQHDFNVRRTVSTVAASAPLQISALRSGKATEYPDGVSPKKKQLAAYQRENPGVSNKSHIARQLNMDVTTVRKYYDEVRAELAALSTA